MRASLLCLVIGLAGTLGAGGCARRRPELTTYAAPIPEDGVVFVADGAGNYQKFSHALGRAARDGGFSTQIVTFEWSHGYLRSIADQVDYAHARAQGRHLAQRVLQFRAEYPDRPVYLAGHSAGAMVVIAALECLPPDTVDNAVLISPSLSSFYDLRPSLRGVKRGLHNFYSERDWVYCGLITRTLGTSDRLCTVCSGRVGFKAFCCPGEEFLLGRLVQRPWTRADAWTGNRGGHFGNYESQFMQLNVLPLFQAARKHRIAVGMN